MVFVRFLLSGLLAWALTSYALSADAAQAQNDSDAHLETARLLVRELGREEAFRQRVDAVVPLVAENFVGNRSDVTLEQRQRLHAVIAELLNAAYPDFEEVTARVYARRFSTDELIELRAFYSTDLGQKINRELPFIFEEMQTEAAPIFGTILASEIDQITATLDSE